MKTPPDNPEFAKFTEAMRAIVKVSKVEMQRRIEAEKRKPRASASRVSGAQPKRAV
jgi:CHASE3 domain sensor protein